MHYSINVSSEPKFKFSDIPREIVMEQDEEDKSDRSSSDASSLITEEDTSGNPLPPEIIKIRKRNKQLQKDLTNSMMNYKSSSRSVFSSRSESALEEEKQTQNFEANRINKESEFSSGIYSQELKTMLDKIMKLQIKYENTRNELKNNEEMIYNVENENLTLKNDFKRLEEEINELRSPSSLKSNCSCRIL